MKAELESHLTETEVLERFWSFSSYCTKVNKKGVEKIQICWNFASSYLAETWGGDFKGFINLYLEEDERLLTGKKKA